MVSASLSFDLATALSKKHEVAVISPTPSRPMGYNFLGVPQPNYPFRHLVLKSYTHPKSAILGRFRESYSFGKACAKYISENHNDIDVIYLNTWPLFGQYFAIKAASKFNIPTILHIQDIYPEAFTQKLPIFKGFANNLLFPLERFITSRSHHIATISHGMKKLLRETRIIPEQKISVVFNWQDETKFISESASTIPAYDNPSITFMFLGSLGPVANITNLIDAFTLAGLENGKLIIAGEGSEKTMLQKRAKDLKCNTIEFINAPSSEAGKIQSTASVLLLSLKKGAAGLALPSKLSAYMFSAKPIIASVDADSDTANAIRDAGCGWVVEPENPAALASRMQQVSSMPTEDLVQMGLNGRDYALQHYSKQANLSKLVSIIEATANT